MSQTRPASAPTEPARTTEPTGTSAMADGSLAVGGVELRIVRNRIFPSNTYVVGSPSAGKCLVIDPGLDSSRLSEVLGDWTPEAVLCTHGHFDHIAGAAALQENYQVPVLLCATDAKTAKMSNFLMAAFKIDKRIKLPEFELLHGEDPEAEYGGRKVRFHSVPGHTPGSVAIEIEGLLFSGDSLYADRIALSQLPGEDSPTLRKSLRRLFTRVSHESFVLPGHGRAAVLKNILDRNSPLREFMAQPD